ncbi:hypothetical protein JCM11641_003118 [Rhodosporidiobolus odoratus]
MSNPPHMINSAQQMEGMELAAASAEEALERKAGWNKVKEKWEEPKVGVKELLRAAIDLASGFLDLLEDQYEDNLHRLLLETMNPGLLAALSAHTTCDVPLHYQHLLPQITTLTQASFGRKIKETGSEGEREAEVFGWRVAGLPPNVEVNGKGQWRCCNEAATLLVARVVQGGRKT